jgi:phosphate/sulfate permease
LHHAAGAGEVRSGDKIAILEAMKMEISVTATRQTHWKAVSHTLLSWLITLRCAALLAANAYAIAGLSP